MMTIINKTEIKQITINLTLNEEEAEWLRDYLRNSFIDDEDFNSGEIRANIFNVLHGVL